jgi:hypothetical protein
MSVLLFRFKEIKSAAVYQHLFWLNKNAHPSWCTLILQCILARKRQIMKLHPSPQGQNLQDSSDKLTTTARSLIEIFFSNLHVFCKLGTYQNLVPIFKSSLGTSHSKRRAVFIMRIFNHSWCIRQGSEKNFKLVKNRIPSRYASKFHRCIARM